ncbi:hypothetical protein [Halogeometricum borinquense]|uniref:hypothetical protein n=1 Tax=Halogeometricum borinquense TaxID=60847 RepID=UPI003424DA45
MAQIIESRFRVLEFDMDDVLLSDIADMGQPVHVKKELGEYSEPIQSKIDELEPGNIVEAEVQSESISIQDDYWKFLDLRIIEKTRFHFLEDADDHPPWADQLESHLQETDENSVRTLIHTDSGPIGYITVALDQGDSFWYGLRQGTNTHEFDLRTLKNWGDPPYEAIYTRSSDRDRLVFYHFGERGTRVARGILSENQA